MTAPKYAILRCPLCLKFELANWTDYMRGLLPLCPEGCKTRMRKATPEETALHDEQPQE